MEGLDPTTRPFIGFFGGATMRFLLISILIFSLCHGTGATRFLKLLGVPPREDMRKAELDFLEDAQAKIEAYEQDDGKESSVGGWSQHLKVVTNSWSAFFGIPYGSSAHTAQIEEQIEGLPRK